MTAASVRDPGAEATDLQRRAADPERSVWVSASAGTGKTKVLTDRVLSLLVTGTPPHRILCLTFTRAAAAEMANRINRALGAWATMADAGLAKDLAQLLGVTPDDGVMGRARALFARVLDAPGGMKIQTIHAFCESLLGRFPLEARLAPHFRLMDERSAAEAMAAARDTLLAHARAGDDAALADALAEVSARIDEERFAALLDRLARERDRLRRLTDGANGTARVVARVHERLGVGPTETEESIIAAACTGRAFDGKALRRACAALLDGSKTDRERGRRMAGWLAAPDARAETFDDYCRGFLTGKGQPYARPATRAAVQAMPDILDVLGREAERLAAVIRHLNALVTARATAALIRLGRGLLDRYEAHKRAHGLLDYDDLILYARDLVTGDGGASWVLYKLDEGIDHILIDEAQDTNPEQWEIVAALAEEFFAGEGARAAARTVFAVGDAKQSIYGFQRADPDAFERMRSHFRARAAAARRQWADVDLHVSFRSTPSVLGAVDAVFAQGPARDGVARGDETVEHLPFRVGRAGLVELWPAVKPRERDAFEPWTAPVERRRGDAPAARLAAAIAAQIRRWIATREPLESRGRPIRAGDVMVLVRRRGPFVDELVRTLKQSGVPVAGVDRMVLSEQLAVRDLVALGETLLLPEDDLTLATVLKGPLFGFDEESLFDLAHRRGADETLWQALRARAHERPDWQAAHVALAGLMTRADYVPVHELYADVLGARRGRCRILARLGHEAADPLDEFMGRALEFERTHPPSLQHFLHWLGQGRVEVKRDLEQATRDEVRVMTVHGSKGLQAPIVFLPDTLQLPPGGGDLLWTGDGLVLWPPRARYREPVADAARAAEARRQEQEYRRLLYVAMTRAEDRLYVCGWHTRRAAPDGTWYELVEGGLAAAEGGEDIGFDFGDGWSGAGRRLANPQDAKPEKPDAARSYLPPPADLPDWARRPAPPEQVPPRPLAPSRPDEDEPAPRSPLGTDRGAAFRRGLIVHRLLQGLPDLPAGERGTAMRRFLARKAHGLEREEQEALAAEVEKVLALPEMTALFAPGSRAEVPVIGCIGDRVVSGQVDRLAVEPGRVRIVDFKTNRPPPTRVESVPPVYLRQMAAYRAVLALVYPGHAIECALLWTDGPVFMPLAGDLLARWNP
jgi:ATP-dependent helicase/nuclease subunit A